MVRMEVVINGGLNLEMNMINGKEDKRKDDEERTVINCKYN